MDAGMKVLIESFYHSIREDAPVPIPYRDILLTSRIMDKIFVQIRDRFSHQPAATESHDGLTSEAQPVAFEMAVPAIKS